MNKLLYRISCICLMLFMILFSVFTVVNTESFYTNQYRKNNTTADTGMSMEDLDKATVMLLDYLNDQRDDLDMQAEEFGVMSETFDEREKTHMIDVKNLYRFAARTMYTMLAVALAILGVMISRDKAGLLAGISDGAKFALGFALVMTIGFALMFIFDFNTFWTLFHHVVFTNDLWLLDPRISTMINMFPLNFFLAMCSSILIRFAMMYFVFFTAISKLKKQADRKVTA
ncbi:MAG: TIGR01906 family membrane protein [Oscillospiraceae bacterium]|nr:TIGR01906 family membrane protein [Oscillospiraceae bacterium]